jgi:hypothetical protein
MLTRRVYEQHTQLVWKKISREETVGKRRNWHTAQEVRREMIIKTDLYKATLAVHSFGQEVSKPTPGHQRFGDVIPVLTL